MNDLYIYESEETPSKRPPVWLIVTALALASVVLAVGVYFFILRGQTQNKTPDTNVASTAAVPSDFYSVRVDITGLTETETNEIMLFCAVNGYNTVLISSDDMSENGNQLLQYAVEHAYTQGLSPYIVFNIKNSAADGFISDTDFQNAGRRLWNISRYNNLSGIMFEGWDIYFSEDKPFTGLDPAHYINDLCNAVRYNRADLCLGILLSGTPEDNPIPMAWINEGLFNFVMVDSNGYITDTANTLSADLEAWRTALGENAEPIFLLKASRIGSGFTGWNRTDHLLKQVMALDTEDSTRFCVDSFTAVKNDQSGSTDAVYKYLTGLIDDKYIVKELVFTSPANRNYTTYSSRAVFAGASDPEFSLTLNGKEVERDEMGYFEVIADLKLGANKFVFSHNGLDTTFNVTYKTVIIASVLPDSTEFFDSGSTMSVTAVARAGSVVKATVGDKTVTLKQDSFYGESVDSFGEYYNFVGSIKLPVYSNDTNLGNIKFTATYKGISETKTGGVIGVYKREQTSDENFTLPVEDGYINVGKTYIAEVITARAETFSGSSLNDYSQPINAYLPKGTVDYCRSTVDTLFTDSGEKRTYRTLRYGKRVYTSSERNGQEIKVYKGTLPDTNSVTVAGIKETTRNTTLTLEVDWKAPFLFEMEPQKYVDDKNGEDRPYYTVSSITYTYVDITFCYANKIEGEVEFSSNHPLFKSAEWIENEADYTLRLHLRKKGSLYGWSAEYDSEGRLVFTFLHPVQLEKADNIYGVSLKNAVILLDPGHDGKADPGATHNQYGNSSAYNTTEAVACLNMCLEMKRQLEALGATVHLTRSDNNASKVLTLPERTAMIAEIKPDVFISVHHNWNKYASANGYESYYFTPMSWRLADEIYDATKDTGMYQSMRDNKWHTYYVTRVTDCPSVLTENGFISSNYDYKNIITNAARNQERCAAAVKGIVEYFKSIQPDTPYTPPSSVKSAAPTVSSEVAALPPENEN